MRLPSDPLPSLEQLKPAETDVRNVDPTSAARRIGNEAPRSALQDQRPGGGPQPSRPENAAPETVVGVVAGYGGVERRRVSRRTMAKSALLDTRVLPDRRYVAKTGNVDVEV
jgi:hypothetical protein